MIDVKTLRIGSIVNRKYYNPHPTNPGYAYDAATVIAIGQANVTLELKGRTRVKYKYDDIQPIPLTEEWLVKFGFDKHTKDYTGFPTFYNKKGTIALKDEGVNGIYLYRVQKVFEKGKWRGAENHFYVCEIEHVHHLQNLILDLTGEELKLK